MVILELLFNYVQFLISSNSIKFQNYTISITKTLKSIRETLVPQISSVLPLMYSTMLMFVCVYYFIQLIFLSNEYRRQIVSPSTDITLYNLPDDERILFRNIWQVMTNKGMKFRVAKQLTSGAIQNGVPLSECIAASYDICFNISNEMQVLEEEIKTFQ